MQGNDREVVGKSKDRMDFSKSKDGSYYNDAWQDKDYIKVDITKGNSDWEGYNTNLKPATELIIMARKPIAEKTVAKNCLKHGVGAINIDASRIGTDELTPRKNKKRNDENIYGGGKGIPQCDLEPSPLGRYPANVIFQCICDEVIPGEKGEVKKYDTKRNKDVLTFKYKKDVVTQYNDTNPIHTNPACQCYELDRQSGGDGASRFFKTIEDDIQRFRYVAKPSKREKNGFKNSDSCLPAKNNHPCCKPIKLLQHLIAMITPKGGTCLDFFMGSGSCGMAADNLGFDYTGIELDSHYYDIAVKRIAYNKEEREKEADLSQDIFTTDK